MAHRLAQVGFGFIFAYAALSQVTEAQAAPAKAALGCRVGCVGTWPLSDRQPDRTARAEISVP